MLIILWNFSGANTRGFHAHMNELLNYHKPSLVTLTKTKLSGREADDHMQSFIYANSIQVDVEDSSGGLYVMWNGNITVQTVSYTTHELYLFVQVNKSLSPFIIASAYVRHFDNFKSI